MEAIWNGLIFIPRYASPKNPSGIVPPSPPAESRHRQESALRRTLKTWRGRLPENWRAMAGLVNGGVVNDGHALVNGGVIRAHFASPCTYYDGFHRANTTTGIGNTDTGQTWLGDTSNYHIASNEVKIVSDTYPSICYIPTSLSDVDLTFVLDNSVGSVRGIVCVFRHSDANNWWGWQVRTEASSTTLIKHASGSESYLLTQTLFGGGATVTARVHATGNTIHCYMDGTEVTGSPVTDSFNASATNNGFMLRSGGLGVSWCLNAG